MEYPDYAPLPESFWQHLKRKRVRVTTPHSLDTAALTDYQQQLNKACADLEHDLVAARQQACTSLNSLVQAHILTRPNLIALLNQRSPRQINPATLSLWRKRGLLHYADTQHINPHNAAAILVMRMLLPGEKYGWLPSEMQTDEPLWWCWRQDAPDAQPQPCPIPMPSDVPPAALLWTPWVGAAWQEPWQAIIEGGSARWAGVPTLAEINQWGIAMETMPADDAANTVLRIAAQRLLLNNNNG